MPKPRLVLASESPRRRELLALLGIPFTVVPSDVEECPEPGEQPRSFVARAALDKCRDVARRAEDSVVLAADTIVSIDDGILGKPLDRGDAVRMLESLSGRCHSVLTAVAVSEPGSGTVHEGLEETLVWFRALTAEMIDDYLGREDVMDKAGAYAIQGFASVFIPRIDGNYPNVVGLPLPLTHDLLCRTLS